MRPLQAPVEPPQQPAAPAQLEVRTHPHHGVLRVGERVAHLLLGMRMRRCPRCPWTSCCATELSHNGNRRCAAVKPYPSSSTVGAGAPRS